MLALDGLLTVVIHVPWYPFVTLVPSLPDQAAVKANIYPAVFISAVFRVPINPFSCGNKPRQQAFVSVALQCATSKALRR